MAATAALAIAMALPASGGAEYYVPPGNSAATQYTEAYPTAGGHRDADKGPGGSGRSPSQALGDKTAARLEGQGQAGREAAEFAAETAPVAASAGGDAGNGRAEAGEREDSGAGGGSSASGSAGGGSSAVGEVLGQAMGSSSGQLGLLLPLIIIVSLAAGLAFLRWRKSPTP